VAKVWSFAIGRVCVEFAITQDMNYRYDGDDPDGEVQAMLDSGEMVAFDSDVRVLVDGEEVGTDSLGGSVYYFGKESEFWTAHRDPDPKNRNCFANDYKVGHYFPDMIREAIKDARRNLKEASNVEV
jgi:hypothetical protein